MYRSNIRDSNACWYDDHNILPDGGYDIDDIENTTKRYSAALDKKVKKFYASVKSRMLVAEVVKRIKSEAEFTFDYVALLCIASTIALLGLIEDSTVVIVASMLVSPLMGTILAAIFGAVISHTDLRNKGIRHVLASLILCVFIGFVFGLLIVWGLFEKCNYKIDFEKWPTDEMMERGNWRAYVLDIFIAIFSGAGAALSVLGDNMYSMVGVAMSASLMPPAVNAGLLWAVAIVETEDDLFKGIKVFTVYLYLYINTNLLVLSLIHI